MQPPSPRFGPYEITGRIGEGAAGVVFRARDVMLGRDAALKVLGATLAGDPSGLLDTTRKLAQIPHPNITTVYAIERGEAGELAVAMELIEGHSLEELAASERLSRDPKDWVDWLIQAVRGLDAAWRKGVAHGDVKPSNLMLTDAGVLKVGDFGQALPLDDDAGPSDPFESGTGHPPVAGTPDYVSPEACKGLAPDHRSDMYSLAASLYHLIAGRPPFHGKRPVDLMLAHLTRRPKSIRRVAPDCPNGLASVLHRMLEKDPDERFRSYSELLSTLQPLLPGTLEPISIWKRGEALAVDLVLYPIVLGLLWAAMRTIEAAADSLATPLAVMRHVITWSALFAYYQWMMRRFGQTVGKMAFRAVLYDVSGRRTTRRRLLVRFLLTYGPALLLAEGLMFSWWRAQPGQILLGVAAFYLTADVLVALGPSRRALHDFILGTWVVRPIPIETRALDDYVAPPSVAPEQLAAARESDERIGAHTVVLGKLGEGGMGEVLRGYDEELQRQVAVKVLSDKLDPDDIEYHQRFVREARIMAGLDHPNLVQVYGFGQDGERHFFTMELIGGRSLAQELKTNGPIDLKRGVEYMIQACEALSAAHAQGVIHRDVKPSNMILSGELLKMLDFGLAKSTAPEGGEPPEGEDEDPDATGGLTDTGLVMGTPHYMSPEQGRGETVDFRSDIYGLGASFFHLLTGSYPFTAKTPMGIVVKHITDPFPAKRLARHVPETVVALIRKMMEKEPGKRHQSYAELIADLRRAVPGRAVPAGFWSRMVALAYDLLFSALGWSAGAVCAIVLAANAAGGLALSDRFVKELEGYWWVTVLFGLLPPLITTFLLWRRAQTPGMLKVDLRLTTRDGGPATGAQRIAWLALAPELYVLLGLFGPELLVGMAAAQIGVRLVWYLVLPPLSVLAALRSGRSLAERLSFTTVTYV